jgi:hypothetical protein
LPLREAALSQCIGLRAAGASGIDRVDLRTQRPLECAHLLI